MGLSALHATDEPNIIFLFCDDLGYGDVGVFHQNERASKDDRSIPYFHTPWLDQLANEGLRFDQHYCAAPVCAPSRASLLTGKTQGHASVRNNQFDKELPDTHTLGSVLQEAGYATAAFGKWGLQGSASTPEKRGAPTLSGVDFPGWPSMPTDRGFDYFFGYVRHRDGHYHYPVEDGKQVWENKTEVSEGMELCFTTDLFTAVTKKWIIEQREENPNQPFLAYLAYDTPHAKLQNPPCPYPEGGGLNGGVQWLGKKGQMINTATGTYDGWVHPDYANASWDHDKNPETAEVPWPEVQKRYANNVRRIDESVGDLMALLEDLGIAENTLIIFSSDNGPSKESYIKAHPYQPTFFQGFGPFDGIKRDMLEGGLRVPTIARWPVKIPARSSSQEPSGHWDWLATFAEAAGLPIPASGDGVSLMPTLQGKPQPKSSTIYSEYSVGGRTPDYEAFHPSNRGKIRKQMQVVLVDRYKGLRTNIESADDDFEIYDLASDPGESRNLANKGSLQELQNKMKGFALQSRLPLPSAERPYDDALIPATSLAQSDQPGIHFKAYQGNWPWMPDFRSMKPNAFDTVADWESIQENLSKYTPGNLAAGESCGFLIQKLIRIPEDGRYSFKLEATGHSMLFVHNIRLIDELPKSEKHNQAGSLPLKAGWHPIRLYYRTAETTPQFDLRIQSEQGKELLLDSGNLRLFEQK